MSSAASPPPNPGSSSDPQQLGKYQIERRLGAGGMGTVYLAHDRDLRRTVALKVLQKDRAENPLLVKRFKAEGQAGAHLQHPHIIGVYESGEIDGYLYLALEYVDGIDLLEWIRKRGPLPVRRSLDIIQQVAEALEHAANKQVVHRDIKPSNIMIKADGTVKLADMGLARIADDTLDTSITRAGTTVGTVDYMSPEQARNSKAADIRSDLYSLGCTWYHMLTGQIPYPEGSLTNKLQSHAAGPIPDPRHLNSQVPEGVSAIIQRLMAKRPEDRYQSPSELLADLKQPYLFRAEVTGDLLAALAGEAADLGDSTDFVLQRNAGKLTPLAVSNSAIDAEIELPETAADINPAGGQPVPPRTPAGAPRSAAPATDGGGVKRQQAGDSSSKTVNQSSTSTASRESRGTSQTEKTPSGKRRPLPARATSPAPATPVLTTSWGMHFDPSRIAFAVAALIVIIVGISWGWQALMSGSRATDPELAALEAAGEQLPDQPRRPPQPLEILPDPEPAQPAVPPALDQPRPEPIPFPGMDEFDETSGGLAARLIPQWLRTGWSGLFENAPVYRIDQRGQTPESFRSLQSAAEQQLRNGAIFQFIGPGPYQVAPITFNNLPGAPLQEITLRGDPQLRTTLLISAHDDSEAWLRLVRGQLRLEQLDLVVSLPASSQSVPFRTLDLLDSDCQITACTWTVLTSAAQAQHRPCHALWMAGQSTLANRALLRDCVVRGELTAVNCTQAAFDLVIGNCWLDSVSQPAVVLRADPPGTQLAGPPPVRRLAVTASTLLGRNSLLQLVGGEGGANTSAQPVELRFRRTNWVGTAAGCCSLKLLNWPRNPLKNLEAPVPAGVVLEQEHCRWWNIDQLTSYFATTSDSHGQPAEAVTDATSWRQFWKQSLVTAALRELEPEFVAESDSVQPALVDPLYLDSHLQPDGETLPTGAPFSGAQVHSLPRLDPRHGQLAAAAAARLRIPAAFGAFDQAAPVVRFDLNRSKQFNEFLNSSQCPSGTTVICFGAGLKQLPPVLLVGKSLRIEFEQAGEGVSLELQPPPDSQAEAWFEVQEGELHLVNAPLSIPRTTRRQFPGTLIKLSDASASLQRCRLTGSASATMVPLLRQTTSAELCYLQILDSQLCAAGPLLSLPVTGLACEIINSLLATPTTAVGLQESATATVATQLMLHHSTIQASESLAIASWPATEPLQLFVKESVFLPGAGTPAPHVLMLPGNQFPADRLRWWELGSGYATGFQNWLGGTATATADWDKREELVSGMQADAVSGERGVIAIDPSAHPLDLLASNLRVREDCLGAHWAEDGGTLGIRLPIGPDLKANESGKPANTARPLPAVGRGRTIPDF